MDVMFSRCSAPPVWWTAFWGSREGNAGRAARPRAARPRAACPRGACPPCLFIRTPAEGAPATLSLGHRQTAACARAGTGPCLVLKDQLAWSPWERQRVSQRGAGGLGLIPLGQGLPSLHTTFMLLHRTVLTFTPKLTPVSIACPKWPCC